MQQSIANRAVVPIAMPGTHQSFLKYFSKKSFDHSLKILDVGAGHGAFSKELFEQGYDVSACDLFPEIFHYDQIDCKKVDITSKFPYADNTFDIAIAIEVSEHVQDHDVFFSELSRILKPGGQLFLSTPNILSLKSRIRFLFRGFFYSFKPLEMKNYDGLQHVCSMTIDQYNYAAIKNGFSAATFDIDRKQNSSRWLLIPIYPFIWLDQLIKKTSDVHNKIKLLIGRILFLNFINQNK
jgi:SAM-dependent methyltransferase